ncbi:MAG TPA: GTPase Era [Kiritimatiellae bacterium]|nr:GTPase Era [Kiritimatiellia bacterium]
MDVSPPDSSVRRSGIVAVVGRANVGKSTLVNRIIGEKISIVSPVAQTTRNVVRGILTEPRGQIVFLDTPGVHRAKGELSRLINRAARTSVEGVDVILLLFDSSVPPRREDEGWCRWLFPHEDAAHILALNKCDVRRDCAQQYHRLWETVSRNRGGNLRIRWMRISALTGEGVEDLRELLFRLLPVGPLLFDEDVLTDYPRKLFIADVIREKLFMRLKEELPHQVAVEVQEIEEDRTQIRVDAAVFVDKESQKPIVIGHKGRLLRAARRAAEAELSGIFGRRVTLSLWVKVARHWQKNYWMLKRLGLVP